MFHKLGKSESKTNMRKMQRIEPNVEFFRYRIFGFFMLLMMYDIYDYELSLLVILQIRWRDFDIAQIAKYIKYLSHLLQFVLKGIILKKYF